MDFANTLLSTAARGAANNPTVSRYKTRTAVVVDMGYGTLDAYSKYRTSLFILSLIGAAASGAALYKRKGAEAKALYSITLLASLGLGWFTRPESLRTPVPAPTTPEEAEAQQPAIKRLTTWLDDKAVQNSDENPAWEKETWGRLSQDLGDDTIPPALKALIL